MPSFINSGREVHEIDLMDLIPPTEGFIDQYYGRIRNGKTYGATADVLDDLKRGRVVYTNWKINWNGYDQRRDFWSVLWHIMTWNETYYKYDKENLRYLPIDDSFMDKFEKITDAKVYLDEGHVIFDSYQHAKFSMRKRVSILHTGHFNRSIIIISQRPTAVHVSARANVNRFFKFEKIWSLGFNLFRRTEFQDMINESVDEESTPIAVKLYVGSPEVYNAYDTKYLRGDTPRSQDLLGSVYNVNYLSHYYLLFNSIPVFADIASRLKARSNFFKKLSTAPLESMIPLAEGGRRKALLKDKLIKIFSSKDNKTERSEV